MDEHKIKGDDGKTIPIAEISAASRDEPIPSSISSSEDPNQLKQIDGSSASPSSSTTNTNTVNSNVNKAKSCKGCLYYSSRLKADSRNPLCVGLSRSLPSVPQFVVGQSEMEASEEGRSLTNFRYSCVGYSIYVDRKGKNSSGQETQTELPVCLGLEVLVDRGVNSADYSSPPTAHIHNKEDGKGLPQHRSPRPTNSSGEEFLSRFTRNANLVANGVAKNVRRVGNQIKQSLDDVFYTHRRRPK